VEEEETSGSDHADEVRSVSSTTDPASPTSEARRGRPPKKGKKGKTTYRPMHRGTIEKKAASVAVAPPTSTEADVGREVAGFTSNVGMKLGEVSSFESSEGNSTWTIKYKNDSEEQVTSAEDLELHLALAQLLHGFEEEESFFICDECGISFQAKQGFQYHIRERVCQRRKEKQLMQEALERERQNRPSTASRKVRPDRPGALPPKPPNFRIQYQPSHGAHGSSTSGLVDWPCDWTAVEESVEAWLERTSARVPMAASQDPVHLAFPGGAPELAPSPVSLLCSATASTAATGRPGDPATFLNCGIEARALDLVQTQPGEVLLAVAGGPLERAELGKGNPLGSAGRQMRETAGIPAPGENLIQLWRLSEKGAELETCILHQGGVVLSLAWAPHPRCKPNGSITNTALAFICADGKLRIVGFDSSLLDRPSGGGGGDGGGGSSSSTALATMSPRLISPETCLVGSLETACLTALQWHPAHAGVLATGSSDGRVCIWQAVSHGGRAGTVLEFFRELEAPLADVSSSRDSMVLGVAWCPEAPSDEAHLGTLAFVTSAGFVQIWDLDSYHPVVLHSQVIMHGTTLESMHCKHLAWAPEAHGLIFGGGERGILLQLYWSQRTEKLLVSENEMENFTSMQVIDSHGSPRSSSFLLASTTDGLALLVDVADSAKRCCLEASCRTEEGGPIVTYSFPTSWRDQSAYQHPQFTSHCTACMVCRAFTGVHLSPQGPAVDLVVSSGCTGVVSVLPITDLLYRRL